MTAEIVLPSHLRPADGRFGSGPSKVRQEAVEALVGAAPHLLGTSHRRPAVKHLVRRIREGLTTLFSLPSGYEVALGNGGASLFWEAAVFGLIRQRSAHAVFGEFSAKFAAAARAAPFLSDPLVVEAEPGSAPTMRGAPGVDLYALTHNETSTGVATAIRRPAGADDGALVAVDGTSAAGAIAFDVAECDAYYFSPQKAFASEGGLWIALLSPAAIARLDEVGGQRYVPAILDLRVAVSNSRADQTLNTPAITTLFLLADQIDWLLGRGGLEAAAKDCAAKSGFLYDWASSRDWADPFVADPALRSPVVCTIDLDTAVRADEVSTVLRANGILDTEAYRKLGRNQLRLATFPAVEAADVERLAAAIDHVVARLLR